MHWRWNKFELNQNRPDRVSKTCQVYDILNVMYEQTLSSHDLNIRRSEIWLTMGYHGAEPTKDVEEIMEQLLHEACTVCRPRVGYVVQEGAVLDLRHVRINNQTFKPGRTITKYLDDSTQFGIFIATAGEEFEQWASSLKDIVHTYMADAIGSVIAEAAVEYITDKIRVEASTEGLYISNNYSPGYCGWSVAEQKSIFTLLPEGFCGVSLNDSCLMHPIKSVSGIVAIGNQVEWRDYQCGICHLIDCVKRKVKR